MADMYKLFTMDQESIYDYSEEAALEMYLYESTGKPKIIYSQKRENGLHNGYAVGKHWMDVTIAMWLEDIDSSEEMKFVVLFELFSDPNLPTWFLKKVLKIT